jgi:hypothetical protein
MAVFYSGRQKIGPVPVYDTFLEKDLQALLDRVRISRSFLRTFSTRKTCLFAQKHKRLTSLLAETTGHHKSEFILVMFHVHYWRSSVMLQRFQMTAENHQFLDFSLRDLSHIFFFNRFLGDFS